MSAGDYAEIKLALKANSKPYILGGEGFVVFTVKRADAYEFKKTLIEKVIESDGGGVYKIQLTPDDTKNLSEGRYIWDIRIFYESSKVYTPMMRANLHLIKAVGNND